MSDLAPNTRRRLALSLAAVAALLPGRRARAQRVTDMPAASLPLSGTEQLYVVQNGQDRSITTGSLIGNLPAVFSNLTLTGHFAVGSSAAQADPIWSQWNPISTGFVAADGGANAFVGATSNNVGGSIFPTGVTGYGTLTAAGAGSQVFGLFGRADLNANGSAANELNSFNYAGTPSGTLPPNNGFGTSDYVTVGTQIVAYGNYASSIGIWINAGTQPFLCAQYIGSQAGSQYGIVIDADPAHGPSQNSLLVKSPGTAGYPVYFDVVGTYSANTATLVIASQGGTVFSVRQSGDIYGAGGSFATGISVNGGLPQTAGVHFNAQIASSNTDLSKGIDFYNGQYGLGLTAGRLNVVAPSGGGIYCNVNGTDIASATASGLTATQLNLNSTSGPNIRAGTGAASGTQPAGSLWLRTDGSTGSRLYVSAGSGTWNAVSGV